MVSVKAAVLFCVFLDMSQSDLLESHFGVSIQLVLPTKNTKKSQPCRENTSL